MIWLDHVFNLSILAQNCRRGWKFWEKTGEAHFLPIYQLWLQCITLECPKELICWFIMLNFFVALFNKFYRKLSYKMRKSRRKFLCARLLKLVICWCCLPILPPPPPSNPPNCNLGNSFHLLIQRNGHRKDFLLIFKRHGKFSYFVHVWVKGPCWMQLESLLQGCLLLISQDKNRTVPTFWSNASQSRLHIWDLWFDPRS